MTLLPIRLLRSLVRKTITVAACVVLSLRLVAAMPPPLPGTDQPEPVKPSQPTQPAAVAGPPITLSRDAGPHDASSAIEWWYFNSLLTTDKGHHFAVIGAFFRTGVLPNVKGHYLIYALVNLDARFYDAFATIDPTAVELLKAYLTLQAEQHPDDARPLQLIGALDKHEFAPPLHVAQQKANVQTKPLFSATLESTSLEQISDDGRSWKVTVGNPEWTLDLDLTQPADRPPMLVGGNGRTGLKRADDMSYVSLTRMQANGTLTDGGVINKVTGTGWLDRQWGTSWIVQNNGWDWFGLQLSDGSDLIVYRIRDNATGRILRTDATLLTADGKQSVDPGPVIVSSLTAEDQYLEPATHISYPQSWTLTMPKLNLTLTAKSAFPDQVIPVIGIGDSIWEGVVDVSGTRGGQPVTGKGYMELVGYKPKPAAVP